MVEWMSILETPSQAMAKRAIRMARINRSIRVRIRPEVMSEVVWGGDGDVANLDEIEGIDFGIITKDLVECDDWWLMNGSS